jgi:uncharacterized protein
MKTITISNQEYTVYQYRGNCYIYSEDFQFPFHKLSQQQYDQFLSAAGNTPSQEVASFIAQKKISNPDITKEKKTFKGHQSLQDMEIDKIDVMLTFDNSCPLNCVYCFSQNDEFSEKYETAKKSEKYPRKELYDKIFRFFKEAFPQTKMFHFTYNISGEPLADYAAFQEFIETQWEYIKAGTMNMFPTCLTNGVLLNDERIEWLHKHVPLMAFSLDGPKEIQDNQRKLKNGAGSFDKVFPNILKLLKKEWPIPVGASITITSQNLDIIKIYEFLDEIGINTMLMKVARLSEDHPFSINSSNFDSFQKGFWDFADYLIEKTVNGDYACITSVVNTMDDFGHNMTRMFYRRTRNSCGAGYISYAVDTEGNIYPCPDFSKIEDFNLGNVFDGFKSEPFDRLYSLTKSSIQRCQACILGEYCTGTCMNYLYNQQVNGKDSDPINCRINLEFIKLSAYVWNELFEKKPEVIPVITKHISNFYNFD